MWVPILIQSHGLKAVIIGGGTVAVRKADTLCRYGVQSRIVSPEAPVGIDALSPSPEWISGRYTPTHLQGMNLVIAATEDADLNQQICQEAESQGIFALNASQGTEGTVCFPASTTLEDISISISTGGASPAAGSHILKELETYLKENQWPERVRLLGELRQLIKAHEPVPALRHDQLRKLANMNLDELQKRRQAYED